MKNPLSTFDLDVDDTYRQAQLEQRALRFIHPKQLALMEACALWKAAKDTWTEGNDYRGRRGPHPSPGPIH